MSTATGNRGESIAAAHLEAQGYTVIGRNVHLGHEEIDLIARRDGTVAFVEVKARTDTDAARFGRPARAVTYQKQRHLIAAAEAYLRRHPGLGVPRMDVIEVYLDADGNPRRVVHMRGAFMKR